MVKIFGINISRSQKHSSVVGSMDETKPSVPLKSAHPRETLGDSGTRTMHGIISEEYNSQLNGIQGIKIFDEMRKSDGTVRAAVLVTTLPIRRAKFFINPAIPDDAACEEQAEFVEHALFDWLDVSWDDLVRQALLMTVFGVMPFEKVYGTKDHEGKTYVTLEKLAPRLPKSILQWELTDGTFGIQQMKQDGRTAEIPGSKLLLFINEREGDNYWGTSMYRAAYKHWYYKDNFYKIDALAFERQGLGVPKITMPQGYTESDEQKATLALQNLRANEDGYLLLPPGYVAEFMDMGAGTTRDPSKSIEHHNKEILQSVLAQFLELGASKGGSGSRALSQDHSDLFLKAMESIAGNLISTINKTLIPELIDLNFNDVTVYPVLDFDGISKVDVAALGTAYSSLVTAGAITPTNDDQQYLRTKLGLPARTQDDIDDADASSQDLLDGANIEEDGAPAPKGPQKTDPAGKGKPAAAAKTKKDNKQVDDNAKNTKGKPTDKKGKTEMTEFLANRIKFNEGEHFEGWRPLSFTEQKVNWKSMEERMNRLQDNFTSDAKGLLREAKDTFMRRVHKALVNGDLSAIAALEFSVSGGTPGKYKALLKDTMKKGYTTGKNSAASEMGIPVPSDSAESGRAIELMADTIAIKATTDLETKAKVSIANAVKNEKSVLETAGAIDTALKNAIDTGVDITAGLIVGQSINNGRNDVFARNIDNIHGLQRSEILDDRTCNFCLSMDGLVVAADDPEWKDQTIFHGNCRGIWVEILKDEIDPPEVTGVPANISDYYGGEPNALIQPKNPIVRKGSLADEYLKSQTK